MIRKGLIAATALAGVTGLAAAETPEQAAEQVEAVLEQMPQIGPGFPPRLAVNVLNKPMGFRAPVLGFPAPMLNGGLGVPKSHAAPHAHGMASVPAPVQFNAGTVVYR